MRRTWTPAGVALRRHLRLHFMVNAGKNIYLTDFLNRIFARESAKNRDFCGGKYLERPPIYHSKINHGAALQKIPPGSLMPNPVECFRRRFWHRHREAAKPPWRSSAPCCLRLHLQLVDCFGAKAPRNEGERLNRIRYH
jgi:hypothetical protein